MFFETIYRWFTAFFGGDMADYLSGYVCPSELSEGGYLANNQFLMYGWIAVGIALAVVLLYYYVINSVKFDTWKSWLLMLFLVGVSNFGVAIGRLWNEYHAVGTAECLIYGGNGGINGNTVIGFGFANFIVSVIFFIIFSFAFKWWSRNCRYVPV